VAQPPFALTTFLSCGLSRPALPFPCPSRIKQAALGVGVEGSHLISIACVGVSRRQINQGLAREEGRMAKAMAGCPAKMGFRMPAEWEPHEQCWMGWPVRTPLPPSRSYVCLDPSRLQVPPAAPVHLIDSGRIRSVLARETLWTRSRLRWRFVPDRRRISWFFLAGAPSRPPAAVCSSSRFVSVWQTSRSTHQDLFTATLTCGSVDHMKASQRVVCMIDFLFQQINVSTHMSGALGSRKQEQLSRLNI
jgi:hypothetical protein